MRAMLLDAPRRPLRLADTAIPEPGPGQVLLAVKACGVCRTDLHVCDGELPNPKLPLVLGHEIVGTVARIGAGVDRFATGQRVGVPWLGWSCGECRYCHAGRSRSRVRETLRHSSSPGSSGPNGPARRTPSLPSRSTPRSSSLP